jgi:hypothetical protein
MATAAIVPDQSSQSVTTEPFTDPNVGVTDQSTYSPETHSRTVAYPSGHVVAFPDSLSDGEFQKAAKASWEQLKQGTSALSESLGGPSSISDVPGYLSRSKEALSHPVDSLKAVASTLANPSNPALLDAAHEAWREGNHVEAATHVANYLLPFIGQGNEQITQDLKDKNYARAVGHTVAAIAPLLFGSPEEAPITSESEAAQAAARQAITNRPSAATAADIRTQNIAAQSNVKPVVPLSPEARTAARVIREQYRNEPTPKVVVGEPGVADATNEGIREFIDKQSTASPEQRKLVGSAPLKPSLRQLLSSERGELTIPGTAPDVPTFYSKAEQVANEKVPTNASGDQILATLRNNGVKENEIGWMGLDDFLKGQPKVSKADLQQFIKENQIQLEESTRGSQREQLQAQRDTAYAAQNRMFEDLKWDTGEGPTIGQWLRSSDEAKAEATQRGIVTPERLAQFQKFDDLGKQIADLDMKKATLQEKPTKFEQYTLPGEKSNYKEMLLKIPQEPRKVMDTIAKEMGFGGWTYQLTPEQQAAVTRAFEQQPSESKPFQSTHFDEPNILAHVRFDDRPSVDGKKTLFLEEVQSDWHQQGKQKGYITAPPTQQDIDLKFIPPEPGSDPNIYPGYWESFDKRDGQMITRHPGRMNQEQAMKEALQYGHYKSQEGVPPAPFKSDWHELVMKRMLRHAAENGYDQIAWTTGDQQAARYDLSKQVQSVEYYPDTKTLEAYDHSGKRVISQTDVERKDLPDYIGKEAAAKLSARIDEYPQFSDKDYPVDFDDEIGKFVAHDPNGDLVRDSGGDVIASSSQTEVEREIQYMLEHERNQVPTPRVSGLDLKVGGEWAKALYDRAIPNFLKTYAKKWGAKVGTTTLHMGTTEDRIFTFPENGTVRTVTNDLRTINGTASGTLRTSSANVLRALEDGMSMDEAMDSYGTQELVDAVGGKMKYGQPRHETVHSLDITPAMKKAVMKTGQPIARVNKEPSWADGIIAHEA